MGTDIRAGGLTVDDPAYRRGVDFLLGSQYEDGSWLVETRSHTCRRLPYFETGFPARGTRNSSPAPVPPGRRGQPWRLLPPPPNEPSTDTGYHGQVVVPAQVSRLKRMARLVIAKHSVTDHGTRHPWTTASSA